jgi:hypothetical protein
MITLRILDTLDWCSIAAQCRGSKYISPPLGLSLIGNALTFVTALPASRWLKSRKTDFTNLTVWDQEKTPLV